MYTKFVRLTVYDLDDIEAYTLITVEHGTDEEVLKDLIAIEGVTEASLVYGEFDIHCKIDVDTMAELRKVIVEIRKLRVITTETLIAYERTSKRMERVTNERHKRIRTQRTRR